MIKFRKEVHLGKASFAMWVTEFGMVKLAKALQPMKA